MVSIPEKFASSIKQIIEWHQKTYMSDMMLDIPLNRVLERFYEKNLVDGLVQIEEKDLYYLDECISNATNNTTVCGVNESVIWEIYNWIRAKRKEAQV